MKKMMFSLKQIMILMMLLMITMVSCFAFAGCSKKDTSGEAIQIEDEEVIEDEPDDVEP